MSLSEADKRKVGGSDVAAICGLSPYMGPLGVYARIVHGVEQQDTPAMRAGRILESGILDLYEAETGRSTVRGTAIMVPDERWRCSLDAKSYGREAGPRSRIVEAKKVGRNALGGWGEPGTDEVPEGYACQVQWYLGWGLKTGRVEDTQADVAALLAGDFAVYRVQYDAEVFGALLSRCERFWRDHIVPQQPPPDVSLPDDAELVRRIRREPGPAAVHFDSLPADAQLSLRRHLRVERTMGEAWDVGNAAKTAAQLALAGVGAGGVVGLPPETGYSSITWNTRKGITTTDWKAVAQELGARWNMDTRPGSSWSESVDKHTTTSEPSRVWRPVPLKEKP